MSSVAFELHDAIYTVDFEGFGTPRFSGKVTKFAFQNASIAFALKAS